MHINFYMFSHIHTNLFNPNNNFIYRHYYYSCSLVRESYLRSKATKEYGQFHNHSVWIQSPCFYPLYHTVSDMEIETNLSKKGKKVKWK
jgi:hypothetical protein